LSKRKEQIIEISIKLFNEKGCEKTSTRHIADELGISVGNLYYYFKNKEEIIIEIYQELMKTVSGYLGSVKDGIDSAFDFYEFLAHQMEIEKKYRFLRLEMNSLFLNYPIVKEVLKKGVVEKTNEFKALYSHQIKYGYMNPLDDYEMEFIRSNTWVIAVQWELYWVLMNEKNEKTRRLKGVLNMLYFVKPYLTKKGLEESNLLKSIEYVKEELKDV